MKDLLNKVTNEIVRTKVDECMVEACDADEAKVIELLALDPIDHENQHLALCEEHIGWAEERNEFAQEVYDQLRDARREIGQANREEIDRLAQPAFDVDTNALSLNVGEVKGEVESL